VRITITCPSCRKKSQIDDSLKGKRLRCPYPDCKQPFRLSEAGEAVSIDQAVVEQPKVIDWQATQAGSPARAWDMPAAADWQSAPPPQRGSEGDSASPDWTAGGWQEGNEAVVDYEASAEADESTPSVDYYGPVKKKRAGLIMLVAVLVGVIALAVLGGVYYRYKGQAEEKAKTDALADYSAKRYGAAEKKFDTLIDKFPDSKEIGEYKFMRALCGLRNAAEDSNPDMNQAIDKLKSFYRDYRGKELYKKNQDSVHEAAVALVNTGFAIAEKNADRALLEKLVEKDTGPLDLAKNISTSDPKIAKANSEELDKRYEKANYAVSRAEARKVFLNDLEMTVAARKPSGVEAAQQEHANLVRRFPELAKDTEINSKLDALVREEPSLITYSPANKVLSRPSAAGGEATLLICPLVGGKGAPSTAPANDPVVFSLCSGVVYAHAVSNGEVRWAMRVGIDTHTLPVRMPARPPQPEIALVLSTDPQTNTSTVTAVETKDGQALWSYPLGGVCTSGPILAGRIAYFPTLERRVGESGKVEEGGKVYEIDALEGRLLGVFDVGQPLTVPGGYDPKDRRLFVPAARKRIYVLDVGEKKRCAGVFYTNHTVGGLRAAPIITSSTLVIAEASSLGGMVIKSFALSDEGDKAAETPDKYRIRGWSWFQPYFDGDTVAYLTDRGSLALFGLKRGTSDKALFTLGPAGSELYGMPVGERAGVEAASLPPVGPAQVAHVDLNEWWLLTGGKLYRYRFDLYRQQLVSAGAPVDLGLPLQSSQARGRYLVLGTQALDRCLLTAIDRGNGDEIWQRQLGLMTGQEPIVLGNHVVAIDRSGGLLHLEAGKLPPVTAEAERIPGPSAGDWLANGIPGLDSASPPRVVASPDGQFAVAMLHDAAKDKMTLRRYEPGKGITAERTYTFPSPPQANGTAALSNQSIIVPCRDGNLRELPLGGSGDVPVALSWRSSQAGAAAVGHAVFVSDSQLAASDGFRKILRWERTMDGDRRWRRTTDADFEFLGRIITPLVPFNLTDGEKLLCVGDDTGVLYLYAPAKNAVVRRWQFEGQRITKGPFVRGKNLGVVLDGSTLVWLDPEKDAPLWDPRPFDKLGIAGEPHLVGNLMLVAENTGKYYWVDPKTGADKGMFEPKRRVVPATAAVPLGDRHAFALLSDGTALLLTSPAAGGAVGSR
jgi:outer membrane protein assembly factor BamB